MSKPSSRKTPTPRTARRGKRCDWRGENRQHCTNEAQGTVGMLSLCKRCFGTRMTKVSVKKLDEVVEIRLMNDGKHVGYATWIPNASSVTRRAGQ